MGLDVGASDHLDLYDAGESRAIHLREISGGSV